MGIAEAWPFLIATKRRAGYVNVLVPGFLSTPESQQQDMRGVVSHDADRPAPDGTVFARPVMGDNESFWIAFRLRHLSPVSLPPAGGYSESSSSRPVVLIEGVALRTDGTPSQDYVIAAISAALPVCKQAFDQFWTSESLTDWPVDSKPISIKKFTASSELEAVTDIRKLPASALPAKLEGPRRPIEVSAGPSFPDTGAAVRPTISAPVRKGKYSRSRSFWRRTLAIAALAITALLAIVAVLYLISNNKPTGPPPQPTTSHAAGASCPYAI